MSPDHQYYEVYFQKTVTRDSGSRFIVRLQFVQSSGKHSFPDSQDIAVACLLRSEKKRLKNQVYVKFMSDCEELGHMEKVPCELLRQRSYYLPHHAVFHINKIRVVLEVSQKFSNGFL